MSTTSLPSIRSAIYVRVSTTDQACENQLLELHRYVAARGWTAVDYVDQGISGAKDRRPALDKLLADARRRRFDVLVVWRLDRLGRNLRHLVTLLEDVQALGIAFVSPPRASMPRRQPGSCRCTSWRQSPSSSERESPNGFVLGLPE